MYKKQMIAQKILCLAAIIVAAIFFIYALGYMTDIYDSMYTSIRDPDDYWNSARVYGAWIYFIMQDFNAYMLACSIVLILLAALLFLTNTNVRRRYYIGNFLSTALYSVAAVVMSVIVHGYVEAFKTYYKTYVDFDQLKEWAESRGTLYIGPNDTFWFDLHYLVCGLLILVAVLLVANCIWKVMLMKDEAAVVKEGKGAVAR